MNGILAKMQVCQSYTTKLNLLFSSNKENIEGKKCICVEMNHGTMYRIFLINSQLGSGSSTINPTIKKLTNYDILLRIKLSLDSFAQKSPFAKISDFCGTSDIPPF